MNDPAAAAPSIRRSSGSNRVDEMQTLRTGLELARASQLTMVRLQLALHKSNRRSAMQALDNLLEIDAEMEGLAATLNDAPTHLTNEAALFGFIGFQKEAIAAEKHVLARSDLRFAAESIAVSAAALDVSNDQADAADAPALPLPSDGEAEEEDRTGTRLWLYGLAAAIVIIALGCGLIAYLWPTLFNTALSFKGLG